MKFTIGTGGINDPEFFKLLTKLGQLIKKNKDVGGASNAEVVTFIEANSNTTFVDKNNGQMYTFKELAKVMSQLFEGIKLDSTDSEDADPADWWKD